MLTHKDFTSLCWWQQVRPVAQLGLSSGTLPPLLERNADGPLVLGLCNLYEVAFHVHELESVFVSCCGQG